MWTLSGLGGHGGQISQVSQEEKSVTIPRELITVAQVTCLLTITMIEGQGTPYWFIEKLTPHPSQDGDPAWHQDPRDRGQREQLFARLQQELTPLSRYLLKTYEVLDACKQELRHRPLSAKEQIWLLDRIHDLVPRVYAASTAAEREHNPLRIIGLLVNLVGTVGDTLIRTLAMRIDATTLHELQASMHGVAALYQAIGYASPEQRDVLTSELGLLVPVIAAIERRLREALSA